MGATGPVPKRSSQRRRRNKESQPQIVTADGTVYGDPLEGEHSEQAQRFWKALRNSGQAQFYEPSDWAAAELIVLAVDAFVAKPSAFMLTALNSAMGNLLVTEGDRRRVRLELERDLAPAVDDDVTSLNEYRARLSG